jgi:O-antigen/teichoic acid export membrane protein
MSSTEMDISQVTTKPAAGKLDRSMVRAIAWTGAAQWAAQVFSWISTVYVARLLTPNDYGVFAMATIYTGFISLISEFGVGSAVIIMRDLGPRQLAELNTISLGAGLLCFAISFAAAPMFGWFFSSGQLPSVILVMSAGFVISAFKVVPDSVLQQELRFKLVACLDAVRSLVQAAATLIAALLGWSYWSFVAGYLFGTAVGTGLTLVFRRHRFRWPQFRVLKPALGLSRNLLVVRVGWYLYTNADFLIAGRVLGEAALGAYQLAWSISNIPADKLTGMVNRTSQAFFSAVQRETESLRRYLLALTQGLSLVAIPASVGMSLVADEFVSLVLGSKWQGAVLPLRFLAFYVAVRTVAPLISTVLNVRGNSGFLARNSIIMSVLMPAGFYVGSRWGAAGIAAAWIVMYPICLAPLYWRALHDIDLSLRQYATSLRTAVTGTLSLTAVVLVLKYSLPATVPLSAQLALEVFAGMTAYAAFIFVFHRSSLHMFRQVFALLRNPSPEGVPS